MGVQLPVIQPSRRHEQFDAARELEARLRATVRGEVRFDAASRALYATDASNYRQTPIGVVIPQDAADVEATLAACRELGAAVLPRGAGTSLAGQCCNVAVVLDFSKYMRRLVALDPERKTRGCGAGDRARPGARGCGAAPPDVCAGSGHAQPMHDWRDDRQQFLRDPQRDGRA